MTVALRLDACPGRKGTHPGVLIIGLMALLFVALTAPAAEAAQVAFPRISIGVDQTTQPGEVAQSLQVLFLLTVLSLAPSILILTTSFTRIVIVLSFVRSALATQQMPPNQVLVGLSLFLTLFIMFPTWQAVNNTAIQPYLTGRLPADQALSAGLKPVRQFMLKQTREKDLALFVEMSKTPRPRNPEDVPTQVVVPAFVISELKTAFQIGFMIFIPFLVIDMIVASTLMSMGMVMLPPVTISLPFKILLFVLVDGWYLVVRSLLLSFK